VHRSPHAKRPSVLAGTWYPEEPEALFGQVDQLLKQARSEGASSAHQPTALIVPHAGMSYSGPTAAHAFASVRERPKRILLLGPSHRLRFRGISAGLFSYYCSPVGDFPVDVDAINSLLEAGAVQANPEAHDQEHCLEMMLPFIGTRWGSIPILPLLVGHSSPHHIQQVLEHIFSPGDLICVSSDLSHFLTYAEARERDLQTLESIRTGRWEALGPEDACGCTPIAGLIQFSRRRHLICSVLDYRNSGDTAGNRERVVGYGALAYRTTDSG